MGKRNYADRADEMLDTLRGLTLSAMTKRGWSRRWRLALANFLGWGVDIGREIDAEGKRNG